MPSPRKKPAPPDNTTDPPTAAKKPAAKRKPAAPRAKKASTGLEPAATRSKRTAKSKATAPDVRPPLNPDGSGGYDLLIVESPAKAKTINKYLGNKFKVLASYGHVRDLATGRKQPGEEVSGIRIADGWKLRYLVDAGAKAAKNKGKGKRTPRRTFWTN